MSFASNPNIGMGGSNREQTPEEGIKLDSDLHPSNDVPLDLTMPRYPNRGPKVPRAGNSYFAAARSKGATASYDVDLSDQPIDYSKKYVESNSINTIKSNYVPRNSLVLSKVKTDPRAREKTFPEQACKVDPYGDYAETDLDQPTDYSLRYAEDDTDYEEKQNAAYFAGNEQEDTVKTYCTEGTPYETPLNFSSATSMSDLRLEDAKEVAKKVANQDARNNNKIVAKEITTAFIETEQGDVALTKESKNINNKLVISSSSVSIEKPVKYYDEGTPGRISRGSSLSSLGCAIVAQNEEAEEIEEAEEAEKVREQNETQQTTPSLPVSPIPSVEGSREETEGGERAVAEGNNSEVVGEEEVTRGVEVEEKDDDRSVDKEGKVVTFGGEDHYAEETPLMFSRSSSLGSLSGFEQQSIHDDRSSIVSDFSRRTSGVVSPSELPDSPTQTVFQSPRHNHRMQSNDLPTRGPPLRNFSYNKSPRSKPSVFEDNIAAFKEESTPIEFSAATSLSSLTIDDEPKLAIDSKEEKSFLEKARTLGRSLANTSAEVVDGNGNEISNENEGSRNQDAEHCNYRVQEPISDGDEDDEDILAACINMGMRNSTYRKSFKEISECDEKVVHRIPAGSATNLVRYQTSSTLDRLDALSPILKNKIAIDTVTVPADTLRVYCTEDTPADISPVGSQSNLSALSMLSNSAEFGKGDGNLLSGDEEEGWVLSGEDDKILDQCIRSGIPQARLTNNSLPGATVAREFLSTSPVAAQSDVSLPRPAESREVPSTSLPTRTENDGITIHCDPFNIWRSPPESTEREKEEEEGTSTLSRAPITIVNGENLYDDSPNNSDDDAILTECILSAMPKARTNTLSFVNSQPSRKTPEALPRHSSIDEVSSFPSSHVVNEIFKGSVARITIRQIHETEELYTDTSSISEDEEDLILAQCIRSGMPKASNVPTRIITVKKDDRGNNE